MKRRLTVTIAVLVAANVLVLGVLSFYRSSQAAPATAREPFANSVTQRAEMIEQLKAISAELREVKTTLKAQQALLESGRTRVVVTQDKPG